MKALVLASTIILATLTATAARATPNFPSALKADLMLSHSPDCSLCHTDGNQGGRGTVNTPFGVSMRADGLIAYDTASLAKALDEMEADGTDSVGDCVPDVTELKDGKNPNINETGQSCTVSSVTPTGPEYGCGARVAPVAPSSGGGVLAGAALALAVILRRARR